MRLLSRLLIVVGVILILLTPLITNSIVLDYRISLTGFIIYCFGLILDLLFCGN